MLEAFILEDLDVRVDVCFKDVDKNLGGYFVEGDDCVARFSRLDGMGIDLPGEKADSET